MDIKTVNDEHVLRSNEELLLTGSCHFLKEMMGDENWLQWKSLMDRSRIDKLPAFITWLLSVANNELSKKADDENNESLRKRRNNKSTGSTGKQHGKAQMHVDGGDKKEETNKTHIKQETDLVDNSHQNGESDDMQNDIKVDEKDENFADKKQAKDQMQNAAANSDAVKVAERTICCYRLASAVKSGDVSAVRGVLDKIESSGEKASAINMATDMCDKTNPPVILLAVEKGLDMAKLLIEHGADVSKSCRGGMTPLMKACKEGDASMVKILLENGAVRTINYCGVERFTALHFAALCTDEKVSDIVEMLVQAGADCNAKAFQRRTPLHFAAERGHLQVVQLLLHAGASACTITITLPEMFTPRLLANREGHNDVETYIKNWMEIHPENSWEYTINSYFDAPIIPLMIFLFLMLILSGIVVDRATQRYSIN